jgi:hypothetical protein
MRTTLGHLRARLELSSASASTATTATLLVGVLVLQLAMIGSYVGALHAPKARNVPIAIVGPPSAIAPVRDRLARGGILDPRTVATPTGALAMIDDRQVYAALIPGQKTDRLVVAPAASAAVAELLPSALARLEPAGRRLAVQTVKPLPANDPRGISPFYLVVGWLVGGYVGATVLGLARGGVPRTRRWAARRLGALACYAVASGVLGTLLVHDVVGVLEGHTLALAATGTLLVFATGAATAALQAALGIAGTALAILLFVAVGNPASGGPLATELLMPTPWRAVGWLLPPGAGTTLVRNITYFDGNAIGRAAFVLAAYSLVGSLVVLALARRGRATTSLEAEVSAAASIAA